MKIPESRKADLVDICELDLRAAHARTLLPAALASVSFGFDLEFGPRCQQIA